MENRLDKIDMGILKLLEKDARLTHKEIAHSLNLSITPIHARIRKLQDEGYIQRYTAIINHKMVGRGLIAYTQVHLKEHSQESLKAFMEASVKLPEVMECYHMTGAFDFLLRIAIKDMDEYNKVLFEKLTRLPDVGNMQSFFVMSEVKHETGYMFDGHS